MLTVSNILKNKTNNIFSVEPGITVYEAVKVMGEKKYWCFACNGK